MARKRREPTLYELPAIWGPDAGRKAIIPAEYRPVTVDGRQYWKNRHGTLFYLGCIAGLFHLSDVSGRRGYIYPVAFQNE